MRRTSGFLSSTIALVVVALLASSGGFAVSVSRAVHGVLAEARVAAHPSARGARGARGASGRASEPEVPGRTAFLHAQPAPIARIHASHASGSDGARHAPALDAQRVLRDLATRRAPGAAVDARRHGVTSPGQPAPSSRAPPIA